jgi:hypothetical protein
LPLKTRCSLADTLEEHLGLFLPTLQSAECIKKLITESMLVTVTTIDIGCAASFKHVAQRFPIGGAGRRESDWIDVALEVSSSSTQIWMYR